MPDLTRDLEATQGDRYRCPFCDARRGLSYDPDTGDSGVWHCFSCQRGGDGVELYAEMHRVELREALQAFGIRRESVSGDVKRKEQRAPKPTTPDYSDAEQAERTRAWKAMTKEEVRLRDLYRQRRAKAQETRDRDGFERWQEKIDDLFAHVLRREMAGHRKAERMDADTKHLDTDE